jgi:hypothetical protein
MKQFLGSEIKLQNVTMEKPATIHHVEKNARKSRGS